MPDPPKRRLPVLQNAAPAEESAEDRPPLHWAGAGTVAIFIVWLPLAGLINALLRRIIEGSGDSAPDPSIRVAMVGLNAVGFMIAGLAGGYIVGRYGGRAGVREATAAGLIAGAIAWTLALVQGAPAGVLGWALMLGVIATLGGGAANLGGRIGIRRRPRV